MAAVPTLKLPSGAAMPMVGLGTWKSKAGDVEAAVKEAIDCGYRHIDAAFIYQNEKEVGNAIKAKIDEGVVKREDLFITSKIWNNNHAFERVKPGLKLSLQNLGLDYLDLFLIHWPHSYKQGDEIFPVDEQGERIFVDTHYMDTYKALEECVAEGLVRDIGISNFNHEQVQHVLDNCKIKPATNQIEVHPYFANTKLVDYCKERGIHITAYSPLGSADRPWAKEGEPSLLDDGKIKEIAAKYKKSSAQIILKHLLRRGLIIIPKSVTASRIKENFQLFDFDLAAEDDKIISEFNVNYRLVVPYMDVDGKRVFRDGKAPNFPFHIEF